MRAHRRRRRTISRPSWRCSTFPAWDCLPYDRSLAVAARRPRSGWRRCTRCSARPSKPQLLVTTVNAATQRTLTPFRIRQLVARLAPGERIDRDQLAALLQANGYVRTDTVADAGEFAVRGGLVDLFPVRRGAGAAARFLRRRDRERPPLRSGRPAHHRPDRRLHPAARVRGPARRGQHQALPRAAIARGSAPPRPAIRSTRRSRDGRRLAGHGALAAAVRGAAGDAVRPSRRRRPHRPRRRRRRRRRGALRGDRRLSRQPRPRARSTRSGQLPPARRPTRSI